MHEIREPQQSRGASVKVTDRVVRLASIADPCRPASCSGVTGRRARQGRLRHHCRRSRPSSATTGTTGISRSLMSSMTSNASNSWIASSMAATSVSTSSRSRCRSASWLVVPAKIRMSPSGSSPKLAQSMLPTIALVPRGKLNRLRTALRHGERLPRRSDIRPHNMRQRGALASLGARQGGGVMSDRQDYGPMSDAPIALSRCALESVTPVRFVRVRFVPVRFAPVRSASVRSAVSR